MPIAVFDYVYLDEVTLDGAWDLGDIRGVATNSDSDLHLAVNAFTGLTNVATISNSASGHVATNVDALLYVATNTSSQSMDAEVDNE